MNAAAPKRAAVNHRSWWGKFDTLLSYRQGSSWGERRQGRGPVNFLLAAPEVGAAGEEKGHEARSEHGDTDVDLLHQNDPLCDYAIPPRPLWTAVRPLRSGFSQVRSEALPSALPGVRGLRSSRGPLWSPAESAILSETEVVAAA